MKARITGFTAVPEYRLPSEAVLMSRGAFPSVAQHEKRSKEKAGAVLGKLTRRARTAGVKCDTQYALSNRPDEAIAAAAKKSGCDLILMVSHGRSGLSALFNGSESRGVLAKTTIPTLIYR